MKNLKEDKNLLHRDLCARLPYGVKLWHESYVDLITLHSIDATQFAVEISIDNSNSNTAFWNSIEQVKPYLFPLSSMTEEQKIECFKGTDIELDEHNEIWSTFPISNSDIVLTNLNNWLKVINWLNKNHFDYQGLIEKGLAIDATGLNIY